MFQFHPHLSRVAREGRKRALPKSLEKQPSRDIKKGKSETEQSKGAFVFVFVFSQRDTGIKE